MEQKTLWQTLADALKEEGFDVYPPAYKKGECQEEYIVIKDDGASQIGNFSSQQRYYTFLLYVPYANYTAVEPLKTAMKKAITKRLYPLLMPTGLETPDFYDDTFKAHMVSVQYRCNVREKHL